MVSNRVHPCLGESICYHGHENARFRPGATGLAGPPI